MDMEEDHINSIITTPEEKVTKWHGLAPETVCSLHRLRGIIDGTMKTCHLHMHCEAVFTVLMEACHRVQLNSFTNTDEATELNRLDDNFKVLDIVSQYKMLHSHFPRPWSSISFLFPNCAALCVGSFLKLLTWVLEFMAVIPL